MSFVLITALIGAALLIAAVMLWEKASSIRFQGQKELDLWELGRTQAPGAAQGMIDTSTGDLVFDSGDRVRSRCKSADLLALPIGANADVGRYGYDGLVTVKIRPQAIGGRSFLTIYYFSVDVLHRIELIDNDPRFGTSFETDDPQSRKQCHDDWLAATLGPPPYEFAWGRIESVIIYDPKVGCYYSFIGIC